MQRVQQMLGDCTQTSLLFIPLLIPCGYLAYSYFTPAPARINNTAKSTLFSAEELQQIEGTSDTITLPDGRTLGYAQYGLRSGRTVFYNHGLPGSRIEAAAFDAIATRLGARIIAVDRPGYGLSSPQPSRTILGLAKDIECLAESLSIDSYGVLVFTSPVSYLRWCFF